jgi:hypothetical protein
MRLHSNTTISVAVIVGMFAGVNGMALLAVVTDTVILACATLVASVFGGITGLYRIYSDNRKEENARALELANLRIDQLIRDKAVIRKDVSAVKDEVFVTKVDIGAIKTQNKNQEARLANTETKADDATTSAAAAIIAVQEVAVISKENSGKISRLESGSGEMKSTFRSEPQD